MSDDIIERLLERATNAREEGTMTARCDARHFEEAAAEIKTLRSALKPFAEAAEELDEKDKDNWDIWEHYVAQSIEIGHLRVAATALKKATESD